MSTMTCTEETATPCACGEHEIEWEESLDGTPVGLPTCVQCGSTRDWDNARAIREALPGQVCKPGQKVKIWVGFADAYHYYRCCTHCAKAPLIHTQIEDRFEEVPYCCDGAKREAEAAAAR